MRRYHWWPLPAYNIGPFTEDEDSGSEVAGNKASIIDGLPVTASDIAAATTKGPNIAQVYQYVLEGWPQKGVSDNLKAFYQQRVTNQGCLV